MRTQPEQSIVAIDIGTTKICVLVGMPQENGTIAIVGIGTIPSHGLSRGVVVDIAQASESIKAAVAQASLMAGFSITHATVGISGAHINSYNSSGMIPIAKGFVKDKDIAAVVAAAQAIALDEQQQVLHVIPQWFTVDGQGPLSNPAGMHGVRLETQVHIITGSVSSVQNIITCCSMAGIHVDDIVLEQLASAHAVLTNDERNLGVIMVDIGGGTADIAVYHNKSLLHTKVIAIAGNHVTRDIAIVLRTSLPEAERIKREHGSVLLDAHELHNEILIGAADGKQVCIIQQQELTAIIYARAYELLSLIQQDIVKHQLTPYIRTGLVLTGGGSLLPHFTELAARLLALPTRLGIPQSETPLAPELQSPIYATAYGLLVHAVQKKAHPHSQDLNSSLTNRILQRMKSWVADFF